MTLSPRVALKRMSDSLLKNPALLGSNYHAKWNNSNEKCLEKHLGQNLGQVAITDRCWRGLGRARSV